MSAEKFLKESPETGYLEVSIGKDGIRMNLTGEAKELLKFLKENGIEVAEPEMEWCG
jgi:hypothetical protein